MELTLVHQLILNNPLAVRTPNPVCSTETGTISICELLPKIVNKIIYDFVCGSSCSLRGSVAPLHHSIAVTSKRCDSIAKFIHAENKNEQRMVMVIGGHINFISFVRAFRMIEMFRNVQLIIDAVVGNGIDRRHTAFARYKLIIRLCWAH